MVELPYKKYAGELVADIAIKDPTYLRWLLENVTFNHHPGLAEEIHKQLAKHSSHIL